MKRGLLCVLGLLTMGGLASAVAAAEPYPNKNIEIIIPKNPGGGTDTSARILVEHAKPMLAKGVSFIPVNKPAGNGVTGVIEGANAKPDGYTLVMLTVELAMYPHQGRMPVTYENFTPLIATIANPCSLIVKADSPYKDLKSFIAAAKANPGKLKVGNAGMGGIMHLVGVNLEKNLGVTFNHIPYNEGSGPSIAALVGGHLDAVLATPDTAKAQADAGLLRILGVADEKRMSSLPNVPTFKEEFNIDFAMRAWAVLAAPKALPKDVHDYLINMFSKVAVNPEYQAAMKKAAIDPVVLVGPQATTMLKTDHETYKKLMTDLKI